MSQSIYIATRGSALALAQSNMVLAQCRAHFSNRAFELKIIKTTGDKLQTLNLTNPNQTVTKGLFTKELEVALINKEADFAVHSLKDLPTELPEGLYLSAVSEREDVRDVLLYRDRTSAREKRGLAPNAQITDFPASATIATSSTRRQAQLLAIRPDLKTVPIRGNVGTRIKKLHEKPELDGIILALAGLKRLGYKITPEGKIEGKDVPEGLLATILPIDQMLPCVGQAALGFESRIGDKQTDAICARLNDLPTFHCVTAERAFLQAMGGGCLSPVAAHAQVIQNQLRISAVSFRDGKLRRTENIGPFDSAFELGRAAARAVGSPHCQ
ncbi:MAG TPA: hydroxymethylbilane synthase [Verrucomicrobiae bacterium]|jgi:hydroxymethylbilane synthase|nr:hydroxymethylbilane synthase [Verrucomicrobiae bacterium]